MRRMLVRYYEPQAREAHEFHFLVLILTDPSFDLVWPITVPQASGISLYHIFFQLLFAGTMSKISLSVTKSNR